mgnify:CR=1 FL=1
MFKSIKLICLILLFPLAFFSCKNKDDTKIKDETKVETTSSSSSDCPKYDRSEYSHWVDVDGDCQDTRVEVLVAENIGTISYLTDSSCKVVTGSWYDPFTDTTFSTASRLDVDHMVPLKEAHESGAYLWSSSKKKEFANELSPSETLIAVSGSANRSKGSRDPAEWLPTNTSYHTTYATNWASIKIKWELTADAEEIATLKSLLGSSATLPIQADETLCTGSVDESVTDNASCCKWCSAGKACGDTCISKSYACTKSKGCACDR